MNDTIKVGDLVVDRRDTNKLAEDPHNWGIGIVISKSLPFLRCEVYWATKSGKKCMYINPTDLIKLKPKKK